MPYLILHKVRGEGAFDIAEPMIEMPNGETWWIIPTSGHRAYPYWYKDLDEVIGMDRSNYLSDMLRNPPVDLRDHYTILNPPTAKRQRVDDSPRPEDL